MKKLLPFFTLITVALLSFSVSTVPTECSTPMVESNYSEICQLENSFIGPIDANQSKENATADISDKLYQFEAGFVGPINTSNFSCEQCYIIFLGCLASAIDGSICYSAYQICEAIFC